MSTHFTYLLINFLSVLVPFIFTFHKKINFHKTWKAFFLAVTVTAFVFVVWDVFFTKWGVWGFNEKYITGIYIVNLPVEEILFFICIPYACVFTYHCIKTLFTTTRLKTAHRKLSLVVLIACIIIALFNYEKAYTFTTFLLCAILLFIQLMYIKKSYMATFYISYALLLLPFLITNGLLTGSWINEPVVHYNNNENLSIRLFTIPIEDSMYFFAMFLMQISLYEWLLSLSNKSKGQNS